MQYLRVISRDGWHSTKLAKYYNIEKLNHIFCFEQLGTFTYEVC